MASLAAPLHAARVRAAASRALLDAQMQDMKTEDIAQMNAVNVTAPMVLTRLVLPDMLAAKYGVMCTVGGVSFKPANRCPHVSGTRNSQGGEHRQTYIQPRPEGPHCAAAEA